MNVSNSNAKFSITITNLSDETSCILSEDLRKVFKNLSKDLQDAICRKEKEIKWSRNSRILGYASKSTFFLSLIAPEEYTKYYDLTYLGLMILSYLVDIDYKNIKNNNTENLKNEINNLPENLKNEINDLLKVRWSRNSRILGYAFWSTIYLSFLIMSNKISIKYCRISSVVLLISSYLVDINLNLFNINYRNIMKYIMFKKN